MSNEIGHFHVHGATNEHRVHTTRWESPFPKICRIAERELQLWISCAATVWTQTPDGDFSICFFFLVTLIRNALAVQLIYSVQFTLWLGFVTQAMRVTDFLIDVRAWRVEWARSDGITSLIRYYLQWSRVNSGSIHGNKCTFTACSSWLCKYQINFWISTFIITCWLHIILGWGTHSMGVYVVYVAVPRP